MKGYPHLFSLYKVCINLYIACDICTGEEEEEEEEEEDEQRLDRG
jgi:hypothetical protein